MEKKLHRTSIELDIDMKKKASMIAIVKGTSLVGIIRVFLEDYVNKNEKYIATKPKIKIRGAK